MQPDILDNLHERVFFHGTYWHQAESIIAGGFQDRTHFVDDHVFRHGGSLGYGVYITCNFATAIFFSCDGIVLRLRLRRGTRIIPTIDRPDPSLIASLKREFGAEIVRQPPSKVLPRNKHLKLREAIALYSHHFTRWRSLKRQGRREDQPWRLMLAMQPTLRRYGLHGVGDPDTEIGMIVFGRDRVIPVGLVTPEQLDPAVLRRAGGHPSDPSFRQWLANCRTPEFAALAARAAERWGDGDQAR